MRGEPNPLPDEQAHIKKGKTTPPATGPEATRLPNKVQHKELGYALNYSRRLSREEGSRFPIIPLPSATPTERAQSSRQITHYIGDELHNQWLNGLKKVEERTFIEHQLKLAADLDPNNREVARLLEDINHFHELMSPQELLKREA